MSLFLIEGLTKSMCNNNSDGPQDHVGELSYNKESNAEVNSDFDRPEDHIVDVSNTQESNEEVNSDINGPEK